MAEILDLSGERRSPAYRAWEQQEQAKEAAKQAVLDRQRDSVGRKNWCLPLSTLALRFKYDRIVNESYVELRLPKSEDITPDWTEVARVFEPWCESLGVRTGWILDRNGSSRMSYLAANQAVVGNVAISAQSLDVMLRWGIENEIFTDGEIGFSPELRDHQPEPESARKPTFDELRATIDSTQSRTAEARLRDAAETEAEAERGDMAHQFLRHLQSVWAYTPSDEQWNYMFHPIHGLFAQMGWSLGDPRNFDAARRVLSRRGIFPAALQTCQEVIDERFDKKELTIAEYNFALQSCKRRGLLNRPRAEGNL